MAAHAFDTHESVKELINAGLLELLKHDLKHDLELLKKELLIKLGMMFIAGWVAAIGIILGMMSVMLK